MKTTLYFLLLITLCLPGLHGQSTYTQWVPGTTCLNCPNLGGPKFNPTQVASGSNTLVTSYTQSACGLNYVQASLPLFKRNFSALGSTVSATQPASFVIAGIPLSANVIKAFMFAGSSGWAAPASASITNATNSVQATFSLTNIGTCADKCWGYNGTQSYRADITSIITGNGTYIVAGIPVAPQSPNFDMDGATIFVIYADPSQNYTGNIVIADGCMGISGTVNSNVQGFSICGTPTACVGFGLIADLQRISNTAFRLNSTTTNFTKLQATDQVWDYVTSAITATTGQTSANFGVTTTGDCYNFMMAGMYYQNSCMNCCGSNTATALSVSVNSANICSGASATLIASPPGSYTWTPGNVVSTSLVVTPTTTTYYWAGILNASGCGGTMVPVVVDPLPNLTLTPSPATVCPGLTSNIACSGAFTYTLNPGNLTGNPIAVNPTIATVYTVVGTSSIGCTNSKTVSVQVYTVAAVTPTNVSPLCAGGNLSLSVGTAFTYTWTGPNNFLYYFQNPVIPNATSANSGIYTVTVLGPNNCYNTATLNVIVNPQAYVTPTVTPIPPFCNTTPPFNLTVTPSGGGWSGNNAVSLVGLVSPTFATMGLSTALYTVMVGPCLNSTTFTLDASTYNTAALSSTVPNLCVTDAPFNLMNIVQSAANGTWTGTGVSGTYTFFPGSLATNIYPLTYSTTSSPNILACPDVSTINVSVTKTVVPTIAPVAPFCNTWPVMNMTVNPAGGTWYGNGAVTAAGVIVPSLAVVLTNTLVSYSVAVGPCKNYGTTTITPNKYYSAALTATAVDLCVTSNPVNLMTTFSQNTVNGYWSGPNVTSNTFAPSGLPTNTYNLIYHTSSTPIPTLCADNQTLYVSLLNPAVPNILQAGPFCSKNAPIQMSVAATGGSWTPSSYLNVSGVLIPSLCAIGNNPIQYIVGTSTCFAQQTKNISVEAFVPATIMNNIPDLCNTSAPMNLMPITLGNTGVWSGPGISGTSFNPAIAGAGNFALIYNTSSIPSGLCPDQSTVAVTVHSLATPVVLNIGPFCNNQGNKQFVVSPVGGYFTGINSQAVSPAGVFNPAMGVIGNNIVSYSITQGPCVAYAQTTVTIEKFVSADFEKLPPSFCRNDKAFDLISLVQNPGGIWSGTGLAGSVFNPAKANIGKNNVITYQTFSSPNGTLCPDMSTIAINVDDIPAIHAESVINKGCAPLLIEFTADQGSGGVGQWNFGDIQDTQNGFVVNHLFNTPGTYSVVFSYTLGSCKTQTNLANPIYVYEKPKADFDFSPMEITVADPDVSFTNLSTVLGNSRYEWTVQSMGKFFDVNPKVTFLNAGKYQVTLLATNVYGCKDQVTKNIEVKNDFTIYFPNSFTPNSDGINDEFMPVFSANGLDLNTYEMEIFDRWGHSLFYTRDAAKGWNGTVQNKGADPLKEGVYVFKIKYKDKEGRLYNKIGNFTLLNKQ